MRSLGYMPNEVELEVIIQRLDMDGISALAKTTETFISLDTHSLCILAHNVRC